jgi:hypothetical protein
MTDAPTPRRGPAGSEHTGRTCPYCRFPLKEGAAMVTCGVCDAAHHGDCWDDNGGCAVVACVGGPMTPGSAPPPTPIAPAPAAPTPPPPPPVPAWSPPASGGSGGRNALLVVAVLVLALAVAGAAVAFVATRKDPPASASVTTVTTVQQTAVSETPTDTTTTDTTTDTVEPEEPTTVDSDTIPTGLTRSEMREDIRTMLLEHHQDLVNGDFRGAWDLMTARKQRQKERDPGYGQWVEGQKTLARYLDPSGLDVQVEDVDRTTGVVRVMVTGMAWNKPSASCSSWSGLTWVRWEQGAWRYDPGYSTTPQRTRQWKSRFSELLGGSC